MNDADFFAPWTTWAKQSAHERNVTRAREKCACVRVGWGGSVYRFHLCVLVYCVWLDAKTQLKNNKPGWRSGLLVLVDNNRWLVFFLRLSLTPSFNTSQCCRSHLVWPLVVLPAVLMPSFPIRRPPVCAPPGCWRPLRRGRWGWEFAFFFEVLGPILGLATHDTLAVKDRVGHFSASFHFLVINGIPKSCRDCFCTSTNAVFVSWHPGLVDKGGACLSSSTPRR